jgi:KDO2-lipid IV(A) lauroyltransferase
MSSGTAKPDGLSLPRRIRYLAEAGAFDVLARAARMASPRVRFAVGTGIGTLTWAVDVGHRRVARDNLRLAYGHDLPSSDLRRLAFRSMTHFARLAVETLAFDPRDGARSARPTRLEGADLVRTAASRGRGVILFTGHLGCWEFIAPVLGRAGLPATGIARPLDNPYLERRVHRFRTATGCRVISRRGAFPEALAVLKQGGLLGIWIDQRPKRGGIPVPFFGHPAWTTDGLARFALGSEAAVIPVRAVFEPDGSVLVTCEPEVAVARTGDEAADACRLTAECTAVVERWVRQWPDQYLWTHRRWAVPRGGTGPRPAAAANGDGQDADE